MSLIIKKLNLEFYFILFSMYDWDVCLGSLSTAHSTRHSLPPRGSKLFQAFAHVCPCQKKAREKCNFLLFTLWESQLYWTPVFYMTNYTKTAGCGVQIIL